MRNSHYLNTFFCFSNGTISRNSHYLRNFSEEYIFLLWKSRYCEEFTLFEYLFCFSNRAISRNSHYLNIFGPKIKSRYSEFALFESALFEDPLYMLSVNIYTYYYPCVLHLGIKKEWEGPSVLMQLLSWSEVVYGQMDCDRNKIGNVIDFPLTLSRSCKGPRGALAMIFLQHFCV